MGKISKLEIAELLKQKPQVQNKITWDDDLPNQSLKNDDMATIIREQSDNSTITIREQSDNNAITMREQSDNSTITIREQSDNSIGENKYNARTEREQSENSTIAIREQSDNKYDNNTITLDDIVGVQKDLLKICYSSCLNTHSNITEPLNYSIIGKALKASPGVIKTSFRRLEKRGLLTLIKYKKGPGGWSQFRISDRVTFDANTITSTITIREQEPFLSSSSSNIKTTTTSGVTDEWNFDIAPYSKFGFTISQIKQLTPLGVITPAQVEQSLIEFAYDIENNSLPLIKTNKINFLMGLFRSGHSYVSEGFKNEQDVTILEMARRSEAKRKTILEAKFEAWVECLNDEQKQEIEKQLPTYLIVLYRAHGVSNADVRTWLFNYYLQKQL